MELFFYIERALWIASVCAEALVVVRFFHEGLVRRYPLFVSFLVADALCIIPTLVVNIKSREYAEVFRVCTLIMTFFRLGFAAELFERICEHFPGIGWFRAGMAAVLVVLAALVAVTVRPSLVNQWAFPQTIMLVILRYQSEIFAAAFTLTWVFLRYVLSIRLHFRPNVLIHWSIATVFFAASGVGYLAILLSRGGDAVFPINSAMLAVHIGCFAAWYRLMRSSGEEPPSFRRLSPDQIQAVKEYNRTLLETVRSLPAEISARQE